MATGIASIDTLNAAFGELRRALDSHDIAAISTATKAVKRATDDVRAQGAWRQDSVLTEKLNELRPLIEAARLRVNLASDDVRQRVALLAQHGADVAPATYGRQA